MAKEQVQIVFSADANQAKALFAEMSSGLGKMEAGAKKGEMSISGLAMGVGALTAGYISLQNVLTGINSAIERHNEELRKAADNSRGLEEIVNRIANQAGLALGSEKHVAGKVAALAKRSGATPQQAGAAIEQLISSGFAFSDVTGEGGSGDVMMQMLGALNRAGRDVDPRTLAESVAKYLQGTGQSKNAASLSRLAPQLYNLFMGTNIQAEHLADLAPQAQILTAGGVSSRDQLAMMSVLVDVLGSSTSATGLGMVANRMLTAGSRSEVQRGLSMLGLKAEDVDLVGESMFDALGRIRSGAAGVPQNRANEALGLIAGGDHLKTLRGLVDNLDELQRRQGIVGGTDQYETAVRRHLGSMSAFENAMTTEEILQSELTYGPQARINELARRQFNMRRRAEAARRGTTGAWMKAELDIMGDEWFGRYAPDFRAQHSPVNRADYMGEIHIVLPNQTRVPGTIKATEHIK